MLASAGGSSKLSLALPSDCEIVLTRDFNAPRPLVFEAWTKREHVMQWWAGCDDDVLTVCEIDFRVGGAWRFVVRDRDGREYPFKGVYLEISAPERLVHTQVFDVEPYARAEAVVSVRFDDLNGRTRMTETIRHATKEARDAHLQSGLDAGASAALDHLEKIAQSLQPKTPTQTTGDES